MALSMDIARVSLHKRASTCFTVGRKSKIKVRKLDILAVLAEGDWGC
jgi:hypothetical protein